MESFGLQTKEHCLHGIPVMDQGLPTNHIRTMAQQPGMEWIWNMALLICIIILYYIVILLFYVLKYKNVSGASKG